MKKIIKLRNPSQHYLGLQNTQQAFQEILKDIFSSRGESFDDHNDYALKYLIPPQSLKGLQAATALLVHALEKQERILIVGDFDADGATSTALAVRCLQVFGAKYVDFLVPNRFIFGYGLTPEIVGEAIKFNPDLIITVDNGISSIAGVDAAKAAGINVLVTDHHLPGNKTPKADAIVNPNQLGCEFPSKNLAGVGVVFYLMSALRKQLREMAWFEKHNLNEPNMSGFLDLVALGTVADVVPLDYNNRILVAAGLQRMRSGKIRPGISAMLDVAQKNVAKLSSSDLGFAVGPRLNAAGRLDDMSLGIRCLLSENFHDALSIARELDDLNRDRKNIEGGMQQEALKLLENIDASALAHQSGVCLYQSDWHQGVIGILASRIKDHLHRPCIILTDSENGDIKGSGRSIPGVHLRDVLDEVAAKNEGLLEKFGGHAMAAGLSLNSSDVERFKEAFNAVVSEHLTEELAEPVILSDGELPEALLDIQFANAIAQLGPWGQHFPEPVFSGTFNLIQQRIVGKNHLKMVLTCDEYSDVVFDAIAFNIDLNEWPNNDARKVKIAYQCDINEYRGEEKFQLLVRYIENFPPSQ